MLIKMTYPNHRHCFKLDELFVSLRSQARHFAPKTAFYQPFESKLKNNFPF